MNIEKEREALDDWFDNVHDVNGDSSLYSQEFAWKVWQAAKAKAALEVITIGNEMQSWVAVNSFSVDDGEGVLPVVDANAIAEKIERLTGAKQ